MRNGYKILDRKDIWQEPFWKHGCEWEDGKGDFCVPKAGNLQAQ